jgi:2-oxo-4-hydroxy-4-carboxy-5-ureidoimidazoline decarboxylase
MEAANENRKLRPSDMGGAAFVETFGGIYEHSPWVAEIVFGHGVSADMDSLTGLHDAMRSVVDDSDRDRKLELLRNHPDLAGRLALRGELTAESTSEQAGAGLDRCSPEELAEFQSLNDRYKVKFGFPFIVAVRGMTRGDILEQFRARVENDADAEFDEALMQVHRIAFFRLTELFEN